MVLYTLVTQNKKTLLVLTAIMLVNALSYGTIIPLLYPYASRFGLSPFGLSVLFTSYSLFQFLATPVIGRLSDRYGRRPLLLISIFGTSLSLALFAAANSLPLLFLARILDGVTGGNMSVAQAVVADTTTGKERAKSFGMLGASFGFGFLIGPALGGFLSSYSMAMPFWFASGLALVASILTALFLPETIKPSDAKVQKSEPLFDFGHLFKALFTPVLGTLFVFTLLTTLATNMFFIGFQTFTVDVLLLTPARIGLLFTFAGVINVIMQAGGIGFLLKHFPSKRKIMLVAAPIAAAALFSLAFMESYWLFSGVMLLFMAAQSPFMPLASGVISERTASEDQGVVLGINQSYMSIGQIVGPLVAGVIGSQSVPLIFVGGAVVLLVAWYSISTLKPKGVQAFDL